ncbi:hypothetical protein HTVC023P_gp79 [Pelagibacter phage HTVC023P]|nr:hypothetical protein HTVC023P_gp79 [Pelagibacter phage HTVC023P]
MDPFTLALATFGVQKLRGKSTRQALKSAAIVGGGSYALGASGILGPQSTFGTGSPFSGIQGLFGKSAAATPKGDLGTSFLNRANMPKGTVIGTDKFGNEIISRGGELSGLNVVEPASKKGIAKALDLVKEKPFETALVASTVAPLFAEEEDVKPVFSEDDYKQAYKEQAAKLSGAFEPVDVAAATPTREEVFGSNMFYANEGGLATAVNKFNQGGVNYLPSKIDHDENDANNYVRAQGYVEDGAGVGDKDEDTMLAQLADGEFVSRADAVLGAGILSGADPKSFKSMRRAGADFFYNQQKQLKRIYDLVDGSKKAN